MTLVGISLNPMNILAYDFNHLYPSLTLFYGGLLMASNMIWAHELVHFFYAGTFNIIVFCTGVLLSIFISIFLLRSQLFVDDKQWIKRMISHHSTAITTTKKLLKKNKNIKQNSKLYTLAKTIIDNQKQEIRIMKSLL
jgi:hypothetical protein